jgi:hypothetical protein
MDILVQIAPQCPVCHAQHIQSLTQEGLREQLKKRLLELYCPAFTSAGLPQPSNERPCCARSADLGESRKKPPQPPGALNSASSAAHSAALDERTAASTATVAGCPPALTLYTI